MIDHTENLIPRLMPEGGEHHELDSVLLAHFGGSVHSPDLRVTHFPKLPPHSLRLEYGPRFDLTGAFAEKTLTEIDIETVRGQFHQNYVESAGPGIGQKILWVSGPMEGCWQYTNRFQIIPVPREAPRPNFYMAAHPFLLEFTYKRSLNESVSQRRREREGNRLALILSSLLRPNITWQRLLAVGNRNYAWVQLPNSGGKWNPAYCQIMYSHESIPHNLDNFTRTEGFSPIPLVPAENYYQPGHRPENDGLEMPDDMAKSFDNFFALPPHLQDRFLQASFWLNQANRVDSLSAMFMHTIQAIESLAWQPRGQEHCEACGKSKGAGPTRLFHEFLERFAPQAIEQRKVLYEVRSGLSHGSRPPFLIDTEVHFGFVPEDLDQRRYVSNAMEAAMLAMHNWLRDPGHPRQP
jgi:hypothetical protein